jgi:hypothetical protein
MTTVWGRTYGGPRYDVAYSIIQTTDGGYVFAGFSNSFSDKSAWLVKIDELGSFEWNKTYGIGCIHSVIQTSNGGYCLAGFNQLNASAWLIKVDTLGNVEWEQKYHELDYECFYSFIQTYDGGYALAGMTTYPMSKLIKVNEHGNVEWTKIYSIKYLRSFIQTRDEGYLLIGQQLAIKVDTLGNVEWEKGYDFYGYSVAQNNDGEYIIAGYAEPTHTDKDARLLKLDESGNIVWTKKFDKDYRRAFSVIQTNDGGYAIAGYARDAEAIYGDFWLAKVDIYGNYEWEKTYGGTLYDVAYSIIQTEDGGYVLAGYTDSYSDYRDTLVIKVDNFGTSPANIQINNATRTEISDSTNTEEPLDYSKLDPQHYPTDQFSLYENILLAIMAGAIILSAIIVAKNYVLKRVKEEKR